MNTPTDRDALARRIFDAAICHPRSLPIHALNDWISLLSGMGGYLSSTADALQSDLPPLPGHLRAIGDAIEKAAAIAGVLADQAESDLIRLTERAHLAAEIEGRGCGGAA